MMTFSSIATASVLLAAISSGGSAQAQSLRPEVGKPLQQAYDLIKAGKGKEALAKVREADGAPNKTAAETMQIERMRAAAAQRAGDNGTAIQALESLHGKVSGAEQGQIAEQIASAYAAGKDNTKASQWVQKAQAAGNGSASLRQLQAYLQSASGDYGAIAKEAAAAVSVAEQAGRRPDEGDLLRLADAQFRTGNTAGQAATLEKLLFTHPKKEYWAIYLARLPRKSGFSRVLRPACWARARRPGATSGCATWPTSKRPRAKRRLTNAPPLPPPAKTATTWCRLVTPTPAWARPTRASR